MEDESLDSVEPEPDVDELSVDSVVLELYDTAEPLPLISESRLLNTGRGGDGPSSGRGWPWFTTCAYSGERDICDI